jgi:tetratricopeptide (TPR) repeat protein
MNRTFRERCWSRGLNGRPFVLALMTVAAGACAREERAANGAAPTGEVTAGSADTDAAVDAMADQTGAHIESADEGTAPSADRPAELELQRGLAVLELGRLGEAAEHFEAALALDPTLEVARGHLGLVRLREGRSPLGLQLLRQACAGLGPGNSALQSLLTAILDAGLWNEAETLVVELLRATPDDPLLLFVRGRAHAGQKRFPEAARDFARVAELSPQHESAPVNEARAYLAMGDEEHAAATLRAAHERMPESRLVMQRLAWVLATANDDAVADGYLAKELALRVLAAAPKSPEYLTLAAAALAAAGEFTPAVVHEELALKFLADLSPELAPPHRAELTAAMQVRLAEYRAYRRWREKPRSVVDVK